MVTVTRIGRKKNKHNNQWTEYNGRKYQSRFEAFVARDLEMMLRAGEIADLDYQYKIECIPFDQNGYPVPALKVSHKVDFRVHELDGSFRLVEAKGFETADYKMRRKWLEKIWLPAHPDHTYEVVKKGKAGQPDWRNASKTRVAH